MIVDIGGGDERTARPWLSLGHQRVVVADAASEALVRFRGRIVAEEPEWLEALLLVEADARNLPLASGIASTVLAIEALQYLNDDYERGLAECVRILGRDGTIMVAERDYEGAIVTRLLFEGIGEMLQTAGGLRWDGESGAGLRSLAFTEDQLRALIEESGLRVVSLKGIPLLPLIIGWLRGRGAIPESAHDMLPQVNQLLSNLTVSGRIRRVNVMSAQRVR